MFEVMESLCQGANFCNPSQSISLQHIGDRFVDNVANILNYGLAAMLQSHYNEALIASGMKSKAQTWERLLWSTSGTLERPNASTTS
jgi:hypothetical protein